MRKRIVIPVFACLLLQWASLASAAGPPYQGRSLQQVLDEFRNEGFALVYSDNLVKPSLKVLGEPVAGTAEDLLRSMLRPHGLALKKVGNDWLVTRLADDADQSEKSPANESGSPADQLELEALSVTASRYLLFSNSQFFIDQRAIQVLPDLGEDPIRSTHRLPGAAAGGLSSRSHFRGGEHNETAIYLNGLKLLDPFHIRDYHSIFSSIDARAISGIEAYTGGFPAEFGDQMSGVLILEALEPEQPRHTELGLSIYNTSVLNSGYIDEGDFDWLVSARRSNLGVVLDKSLGQPDYFDVFGQAAYRWSDGQRLSFNALYSDDQVEVVTESDPEELERSISDTRNLHLWAMLDSEWSSTIGSRLVISHGQLRNKRNAESNDPERLLAHVQDDRKATVSGVQFETRYNGVPDHALRMGLEYRRHSARYDYRGDAYYRGFYENYPDLENPLLRDVQSAPEGHSYSVHFSDRWSISPRSTLQLGVRWDKETYSATGEGTVFSPRLSYLLNLTPATDLRLSWGRYQQSQAIHELQVEDGVDRFFPSQRADHWIAGLQHRFGRAYRLRIEAYVKDYSDLKPRYENLFDPLVLIPELSPDRVMIAPQSARAAGVETTLEYRGGGEFDWWVSYTLARVTDRINGMSQARSWDQRHAIQAGLAWQRGPWEVGAAISVHSGWPTTGLTFIEVPGEEESETLPVPGPRNAEQLGTFAQLDFRISREFGVSHGRLSAFFEVTNATNRRNECCVDFDIDEDSELVLDRAVEHWLPIIPAIGVFWEF